MPLNIGQPAGQSASQALSDMFGQVNRPALNTAVATAQARNGLVSAQTQDAMIRAAQGQEQMQAWEDLKTAYIAQGHKESDAEMLRAATVAATNHDPETALKVVNQGGLSSPTSTPQEQTLYQQGYEGKVAPLQAAPNNFAVPAGQAPPNIQQSPEGVAQTAATTALGNLNVHRDTNPVDFRNPQLGATTPEGQAALTRAVQEGRLDPTRVNSRSAPILAQMELNTPGMNFNRLHADAALQSNATFQQRNMSAEMLPGVLQNLTNLGKKLNDGTGYYDLKTVGGMQKWLNGETNDPAYTEYMTVRNDAMLRLANVMRGVGMSDKTIEMENETATPTLAPYALDAWLKGQMSVLTPMLDRQRQISHLGEPGQGTQPLAATPPAGGGPAPVKIAGDADYAKLAPGTVYMGPDGVPRTK